MWLNHQRPLRREQGGADLPKTEGRAPSAGVDLLTTFELLAHSIFSHLRSLLRTFGRNKAVRVGNGPVPVPACGPGSADEKIGPVA
jgi:hypothetical protein